MSTSRSLRKFVQSLPQQSSVRHPDGFLTELLATHRLDVVSAVTEIASRQKISPMVLGQRLADSQYLPGFGELIHSAL